MFTPEVYSEPCQTSKMERFAQIVNNFRSVISQFKKPTPCHTFHTNVPIMVQSYGNGY